MLCGYGFDRSSERFDLHECTKCGLVRVEPGLAADELAAYYRPEYYGSLEAKFADPLEALVRRSNVRRARTLAHMWPGAGATPRRVLDVGCGRGLFLRAMRDLGSDTVGTELPGFVFPAAEPRLQFVHARAEELPFAAGEFEAVSLWHVLEHTTDPARVLDGVARVLAPGGILSVTVPNFGSLQARLFRRHWFHLDLPRHLYHFRLPTLARFLHERSLEIIDVRTQSWDQNLFGFIQSCLNALFWRRDPNGLYQVLKRRASGRSRGWLLSASYLVLGAGLVPAAVVENLLTPCFGRGATLSIYARRV